MSADGRDFEDARRGFIAALEPGRVDATDGGGDLPRPRGTLPPGAATKKRGVRASYPRAREPPNQDARSTTKARMTMNHSKSRTPSAELHITA